MRFDGKVALVTGAGGGIGGATARIIAGEGGRVAAVDNDPGRLEAGVAAITAGGGEVHGYPANALDQVEVDRVVADAVERLLATTGGTGGTAVRSTSEVPA